MTDLLTIYPLIGPFALIIAAIVSTSGQSKHTVGAVGLATIVNLIGVLGAVCSVLTAGPSHARVLAIAGWGLDVRLDALSVTLAALVGLVGWVVTRFSRTYLDGDTRRPAFLAGLSLTLASVSLLVLAGNLLQLVLAWIATSLALHRILLLFRERPRVGADARHKFVVARLADACLIAAAGLLYLRFATPDLGVIADEARAVAERGETSAVIHGAALLLVLAASLKSAQFPTHGWLIAMVELPTPVSALLHAGLINAGGFLLVRFADVLVLSGPVLLILGVIGASTAVFGSLAMLTQTSVKVSLAYSTVAQMGFMLFQIGLGAFAAATLHLVAHSLYKAHAFSTAGSVVELARARPKSAESTYPHPSIVAASFAAAIAAFAVTATLARVSPAEEPAILALGSILVLGLTDLVLRASVITAPSVRLGVVIRTLMAAFLGSLAYFALQHGAARLFDSIVPAPAPLERGAALVMLVTVIGFAWVTASQWLAPVRTGSLAWQRAYVLFKNGFYVR